MSTFGRAVGMGGLVGVLGAAGVVSAAAAPVTAGATSSVSSVAPAASVRPAGATTTLAGLPARTVSMRVGGELGLRLTVRPAGARTLTLQYRLGTGGRVLRAATTRSTGAGAAVLRFVPPKAGSWRIRVVVAAGVGTAATASTWRVVTAAGRAGATSVRAPAALPTTVPAGAPLALSVTVTPAGARIVELWGQAPGRAAFSLLSTASSSAKGVVVFRPRPSAVGTWRFKAYVRPSLLLRGAWSAVRPVAVTTPPDLTPPGPVTALAANTDEGPTGLVLSWHNPADADLAEVVVRRGSAGFPASAADGDPVVLPTPVSESVHETGLTAGTDYWYSVFTKDAKGNVRAAPTTYRATTMAATLSWQPPMTAIPHHGSLSSVSCPTTSFCLAVDGNGHALTFDGATGWSAPHQFTSAHLPAAVSCATASRCVVVDWAREAFTYTVSQGVGTWSGPTTGVGSTTVSSVSCPTASFCLAVDFAGAATTTADGLAWTAPVVTHSSAATAVSCASASFCAVGDSGGGVVTWDGTTWSPRTILAGAHQITGMACPSATRCVTVDGTGASATYDGSSWSAPTTIDPAHELSSVACASTTFCMAIDSTRALTYDGSSWSPSATSVYPNAMMASVSCPTSTSCTAVDRTSFGWNFRWNGSSWTTAVPSAAIDVDNQTTHVTCASSSFCAAIGEGGEVATYDGSSWSAPVALAAPFGLRALSCPSASFCAVGDGTGRVWLFDGSTWSGPTDIDNGQSIRALACTGPSFCMAVTTGGNALRFDGSGWVLTHLGADLSAVACPTATSCRATEFSGGLYSFDGTSWTGPATVVSGGLSQISCPSASWCLGAVPQVGAFVPVSIFDGATWSTPQEVAPNYVVTNLACASSLTCLALGAGNAASMYDGSGWSTPAAVPGASFAVSATCATIRFCAVVDSDGTFVRDTR